MELAKKYKQLRGDMAEDSIKNTRVSKITDVFTPFLNSLLSVA
jgi:hypothetical protein